MVDGHSPMEHSPTETVLEMVTSMETCADEGDWERVEEISVRLRVEIMRVPETERRACLRAAQRGTDKVQQRAKSARDGVTEKLSEIRRGRDAAKAYGGAY